MDSHYEGGAPPIVVNNLERIRGGRRILDNVSFEVGHGRICGLIGVNGAGKSSLMKILVGLDGGGSGEALIYGQRYRDYMTPFRVVGTMLDGPGAHPRRSARAHLKWIATSQGISTTRVGEVLDMVGLEADQHRPVGSFSLGMGQRLALAAALLGDPPLLILDEPMNGLDPQGIRWIRRMMRQWADGGRTILVSSHLMTELEEVADDVVILHRGQVIAAGDIAQVSGGMNLEDAFFMAVDGGGQ
ncbi:MAG: ATP-binding cassette domain-containing protein [Actinomycetaceae bacterium]|nr:ATP-binding cassette domain-containing protein [Actinomycetaceae bacterium]